MSQTRGREKRRKEGGRGGGERRGEGEEEKGEEKEGRETVTKCFIVSLPFKLHVFELGVLRKRGGQLLHCLRVILVHLDTLLQQDHHTLGGEGREDGRVERKGRRGEGGGRGEGGERRGEKGETSGEEGKVEWGRKKCVEGEECLWDREGAKNRR